MEERVIESLADSIGKLNALQKKFVETNLNELSSHERIDLKHYIEFCLDNGIDNQYLAESYDLIVKDTLREQIYYKRHKRYRYSAYDEVADSVHQPDELRFGAMDGGHRDLRPLVQVVVIGLGDGDPVAMVDPLNEALHDLPFLLQAATLGNVQLEHRHHDEHEN